MKIMSFNTQHCQNFKTKEIDFDVMAKTILDCGADLVGLNEMRGQGTDLEYTAQTERLAALTGMQYYHFSMAFDVPGRGPYGNGLLSKYAIVRVETIAIPMPAREDRIKGKYYEPRCILKAELENGVTVLISHFGLNPDEQALAVEAALAQIKDEKCILMGDFNVKPNNPVLLPIRERMVDAACLLDAEVCSFPSDLPHQKIDYIFLSKDMRLVNAAIPPIVSSDHRPHLAEVEI